MVRAENYDISTYESQTRRSASELSTEILAPVGNARHALLVMSQAIYF